MDNKDNNQKEQNKEENFGKQFWDFLNGTNFYEVVNTIFKNQVSERKTFLYSYLIDVFLVLILIGAVIILAVQNVIEAVTTGTLIGAIIGYALGRFRQD